MALIEIIPYRPAWPVEFQAIGKILREALGDLALRIDHIGSTSIPGLAAKDRIDIQVTVARLDPRIEQAFLIAGYQRSLRNTSDHLPPGNEDQPKMWVKWFFKPPEAQRPTNVHVRINGLPNQRYPLLFRDFLRAMPAAAFAYAQAKQALASYHADDADAYYAIKDPVCDIIIAGAEIWAAQTGWLPGSSDA